MIARIVERFEALSTPTEGPVVEERFDYLSDAQARELFGTEDDDELPDGRVRVCAGEWVRIPGGYYFDGSTGLLHPETASEACDGCTVTITPTEGPASPTESMGGGDIEDTWRDLALQFDAHRIQALSWLKAMVADAETHKAGANGFLASPPLSGEKVLAERLATLTPPETAEAVPVAASEEPIGWQLYLQPLARWGRYINTKATADEAVAGFPASSVPIARPLYAHPAPTTDDRQRLVEALREAGWMVAVHNDYRLNGEAHTFWLWTKGDRAVKGEGRTDAEALEIVARAAFATEASR